MKPPAPWTYKLLDARVVDGDTIDATVDLGFHLSAKMPIRLDGINAAEHGTKAGDAASRWLLVLVAAAKTMVVTTRKEAAGDKYGRILGTLWIDGVNVNQLAIETGHALAYDGHGPRPVPGDA